MAEKRYSTVYEDDSIIVIDKPSGMLVIPTPKKETNTLTDLINNDLDSRRIEANAYPCHRLDRETSGLIVYAKGKAAQRLVMDQFKDRQVKKSYTAFVQGKVKRSVGTISGNIYNRDKGQPESAITKYITTDKRKDFTVVEVEPVTGRTNQIRIHFKTIGHPLVGESVYAFRKDYKLKFRRVALHAKRIEFNHPVTGERIIFDSPMPADMADFLRNNKNLAQQEDR